MFEISYEKKNMNEYNPELIEKLKNPNSELDFWDLAEEYGYDELLDTMAAVAAEKDPCFDVEYSVLQYVRDYFLETFTEEYCNTMNSDQLLVKTC